MEEYDSREFLIQFLSDYGLTEKFRINKKQDKDLEIQERIIDKGVFKKEEHGYYAVWDINYAYKIERLIKEKLDELKLVNKIYYGEKFLLVQVESYIHSFNKEYYDLLIGIIKELYDQGVISEKPKYLIGSFKNDSFKILVLKTDIAYFVLAGQRTNNVEEERIILSSKLEQSQSFFEILAPHYYDWQKLKDSKEENFERIVELLLQKENGILRVIPIGKTNAADRGRDFEVLEKLFTISEPIEKKWLVQCKYSTKSISPNTISGWVERVVEHHYDGYWLITNNDITPSLFDQFKDVKNNDKYSFDVRFWQRTDLHIKMNLYNEIFSELELFEK